MKKHLALLILCLILLSVNSQNVTLTNAVSSETGEYEENIFMWVHPTGDVDLIISFPLASAPIDTSDFESDLSFLDLIVSGTHSLTPTMEGGFPPEVNNTYIFVAFNATIVSISEGKLKADTLKTKFEKLLNLPYIPYLFNFSSGDRVMYAYSVDECTIQKFRDVLLEHKPSQGFGKLVTPTSIENYVGISFMLRRENGNLRWSEAMVYSYHYDYFDNNIGREYTISLKELTGYSEAIQSSPLSSNSTLRIIISQVEKKYKLASLETTPEMEKTENEVQDTTNILFQKTITGSSVEDLSIHFKIVSPNYIDPTTIGIIAGVVAIPVAIGIIVFTIRKKRSLKTTPNI